MQANNLHFDRSFFSEDSTNDATLYPVISEHNGVAVNASVSTVRGAKLSGLWGQDYGIATQRIAGAVADLATFSHTADCILTWKVTVLANGQQMAFRMQDANNYWRLDVAADGSMALQEVVSGIPTSRATGAAGSVLNGCPVEIVARDNVIRFLVNGSVVGYWTSANNFKTATAGKLLASGTGGTVSNIVAYPGVITGAALTELQRMVTGG